MDEGVYSEMGIFSEYDNMSILGCDGALKIENIMAAGFDVRLLFGNFDVPYSWTTS